MASVQAAAADASRSRRQITRIARTRLLLRPSLLGIGLALLGVILLLTVFGPLFVVNPDHVDTNAFLRSPSTAHLFGTDQAGRDVLSRVLSGARPTLLIAALGVVGSVSLGTIVGLLGAFGGRGLDRLTRFTIDVQLSMPYILIAVVLASAVGPSVPLMVVVMILAGWVQVARVVRNIALRERAKDYVLAATAVGASGPRIARRYVMPSVLPALSALAPLQMAGMIVFGATLSYLGLGLRPPNPSWGAMLADGEQYANTAWWLIVFPGAALVVTSLSLVLVADGLQHRRGTNLAAIDEPEDDQILTTEGGAE